MSKETVLGTFENFYWILHFPIHFSEQKFVACHINEYTKECLGNKFCRGRSRTVKVMRSRSWMLFLSSVQPRCSRCIYCSRDVNNRASSKIKTTYLFYVEGKLCRYFENVSNDFRIHKYAWNWWKQCYLLHFFDAPCICIHFLWRATNTSKYIYKKNSWSWYADRPNKWDVFCLSTFVHGMVSLLLCWNMVSVLNGFKGAVSNLLLLWVGFDMFSTVSVLPGCSVYSCPNFYRRCRSNNNN